MLGSKKQYELTGFGPNSKKAVSDLKTKQADLVEKLETAEVNTDISDYATLFVAKYTGKSGKAADLDCPEFTVQSNKGWDAIPELARTRANGGSLDSYNTQMTVRRTYQLTGEQIDAATRKLVSSPSAGIDENPLSNYVKAFR